MTAGSSADTAVKSELRYPKCVFLIAFYEFFERLCRNGIRSVLSIYLVYSLDFSENAATTVYHAFLAVCFFTPIIGGIVADSWLGRFKTIFATSFIYVTGSLLVLMSSFPYFASAANVLTFIGITLVGFGSGVVSPCVSAFGGDQFVLPEQEKYLQKYFSVFYVIMSFSGLLATIMSPLLRSDIQCFGEDTCYPMSFGLAAIFMVVAVVVLSLGIKSYKHKAPEGNIALDVTKCISHGVAMKVKNWRRKEKRDHWLDFADDKFDKKLIADTKLSFNILTLFVAAPPIFWALYDQKGSRWTFQATRMDCALGEWNVKPDQMQLWGPLLLVVLIPIFNTVVYPLFKKMKILQKPLTKMTVGGILGGVAFVFSAVVELTIKPTDAVMPSQGEAQLRLFNTLDCPIVISSEPGTAVEIDPFEISPLEAWQNLHIAAQSNQTFQIRAQPASSCNPALLVQDFNVHISPNTAQSYAFHDGLVSAPQLQFSEKFFESPEKSQIGNGRVRVLMNADSTGEISVNFIGRYKYTFILNGAIAVSEISELVADEYIIELNGATISTTKIKTGGVYTFIVNQAVSSTEVAKYEITPENAVNVFWLVPQYFAITSGEILFSITGLEFAFTQAPESMKTVIVAGWLIAVAFGNIIVIIVAGAQLFENLIWEYVFYAGLMFVSIFIFALQAMYYKNVSLDEQGTEDKSDLEIKEKE
ncbi:solute carrier family 15 member 2-like [Neocloeon triangulifer]|uniref:solute carrier family 15 member 2-like n=1 Tax=Neocloeon triangulifer TaxID=2078957 RepID=UPI00286F671D|nr:solute carrier family 15 member 2-like [Neocloeon triangulifer]